MPLDLSTLSDPASREHGRTRTAARAEPVGVRDVLRVVRKRKWWLLVPPVLAAVVALAMIDRMDTVYTAESLMIVDVRAQNEVDLQGVLNERPDDRAIVSEVDVITSRGIADRVVEDLGLMNDAAFNPALRPPEPGVVEAAFGRLGGYVERLPLVGEALALAAPAPPPEPQQTMPPRRQREAVLGKLSGNLDVKLRDDSNSIVVSFTTTDPQRSAQVVNAVVDNYLAMQVSAKREASARATAWVQERLAELRNDVREAETALIMRQQFHRLPSGNVRTTAQQRVDQLSLRLSDAQSEKAAIEAQLSRVREVGGSGSGGVFVGAVDNQVVQSLKIEEARLAGQVANLSQIYGAGHPELANVQAELASVRAEVGAEVGRLIGDLESRRVVAEREVQAIARELAEAEERARETNIAQSEMEQLRLEAQQARESLAAFENRYEEIANSAQLQIPDARVIAPAEPPVNPSNPSKKTVLALAIGAALIVGGLGATMAEMLDNRLHSVGQAEAALGLPVMGILPEMRNLRLIGPNPVKTILKQPDSHFSECVRRIGTNLLLGGKNGHRKIIVVASCQPGEAKSVTSAALALTWARAGKRTLLIEADMRRPTQTRILGLRLDGETTLSSLLGDTRRTPDRIAVHEPSGLHVIPAGRPVADAGDLLSTARFSRLIETLAPYYDQIVIDTPPVLAVCDTAMIAPYCDATLFVARWNKTSIPVAETGLDQLRDFGIPVAGMVVSRVDMRRYAVMRYDDLGTGLKAYRYYHAR